VVIAINGEPVDAVSELQARVAQFQPGESIRLDLIRYGEPLRLAVRLGEFEAAAPPEQPRARPERNPLGFQVVPLSRQYAARIGRRGRADVPVVSVVDPFSPAAAERVQPRMAILSMNGRDLSVAELRRVGTRLQSGDLVSLVVVDPASTAPVPMIINFRVQ
jgi:S1-C subfamily serine protease